VIAFYNFDFVRFFQLSEETKEDKSLKKKRLDDIMFGLGAAKGVTLDQASNDGNSSTIKSSADTKVPELNKLQDLLGRPGRFFFENSNCMVNFRKLEFIHEN